MRKDFLPFSRPSITEDDIAAVGEVLRSGWITTGPKNAEFEKNSVTTWVVAGPCAFPVHGHYGGEIAVARPGQGSTFTIILPKA